VHSVLYNVVRRYESTFGNRYESSCTL
jgi:hypothetical protein